MCKISKYRNINLFSMSRCEILYTYICIYTYYIYVYMYMYIYYIYIDYQMIYDIYKIIRWFYRYHVFRHVVFINNFPNPLSNLQFHKNII